ncbi:MAG: hypothetical protein JXP34_10990 [Planctomycetes bacterium]|nr:hypothetical protein [Planctomycetota bacterium]
MGKEMRTDDLEEALERLERRFAPHAADPRMREIWDRLRTWIEARAAAAAARPAPGKVR